MESSAVRVLVALVKAERKCVTALENVAEFLKKRKEQSDALFTQAKEEMEEARNKLVEQSRLGVSCYLKLLSIENFLHNS